MCFSNSLQDGWQWKPVRKSLNAAFNMKVLQSFVPIFHEKSIVLSEKLARNINGMPFDISDYMYACALDMVCCEYAIKVSSATFSFSK